MARRAPLTSLSLPGEPVGRRGFLKRGLAGAALLALAGGGWLASRKTRVGPGAEGPLDALTPEEAEVLLAVADRLVPERAGFPRPRALGLAVRMDGAVAAAEPAAQQELRRLVRLFESAAAGFLLDGQARLFTASSPAQQDARLRAWERSRLALRRTGFHALKRLVYAIYYGSPETWAAIGYPGPPLDGGAAAGRER